MFERMPACILFFCNFSEQNGRIYKLEQYIYNINVTDCYYYYFKATLIQPTIRFVLHKSGQYLFNYTVTVVSDGQIEKCSYGQASRQ